MSKIALEGNASGTGTFTIASPNSNNNRTLNLPDNTGTILTTGAIVTEAQGGTGTTTGYYGFKNRIINGGMVIDQRNAGVAVTFDGSNKYVTDRFFGFSNVGTTTSQQSTVAPTGFNNSLLVTQNTGGSVVSSSFLAAVHRIEGFNVADLGWGTAAAQTITLSFWVRSSVTGAFSVTLNNSAFNRSYVSNYTINAANTWEQKIITVPGDTSGTWVTNNGIGISIVWNLGYGSNFTTSTLNSWIGSGVAGSTTATTAFATTTGATFYITGVQLERGSTATSFDFRPYGTELMLCQRYYEKSYNIDVTPGTVTTLGAVYRTLDAGPLFFASPGPILFKVTKRANPTVTLYGTVAGTSGAITVSTDLSAAAVNIGTNGAGAYVNNISAGSAGAGCAAHYVASIEL